MIVCPKHNLQKSVHLSCDLLNDLNRDLDLSSLMLVTIQVNRCDIAWYYVSKEFAAKHHLTRSIQLTSDAVPEWTRETTVACAKCLEEAGWLPDSMAMPQRT